MANSFRVKEIVQSMEDFSFPGKESTISSCAMKLCDFLQQNLSRHGQQSDFARGTKISDATASKWARGTDRAPNFENCLRIAIYFKKSPLEIFEMADRSDYADLFKELFPEYSCAAPSNEPHIAIACGDEEHRILHNLLEDLLHVLPNNGEDWAKAIDSNVRALWSVAKGKPFPVPGSQIDSLGKRHGPFRASPKAAANKPKTGND